MTTYISFIYARAGNPDLKPAEELAEAARNLFEDSREEIVSLLATMLGERDDSFLVKLEKEAEESKVLRPTHYINYWRPSGQFITNDMVALGQGVKPPPHLDVLAKVMAIRHSASACEGLAKIAKRAASHLTKQDRYARRNQEMGTKVFIGHGRSHLLERYEGVHSR